MKSLIWGLIIVSTMGIGSCTKNMSRLNRDPKNPESVDGKTLFTMGQRFLARTLTSANVNLGINRLITQNWQETTYLDESNYDLLTRGIPGKVWDAFSMNVIGNMQKAQQFLPSQVSDPKQLKNQMAVMDIHIVMTYFYLLTTFGNVPYSEAQNIDNIHPKYDDAKTIYLDLMARIDKALANMDMDVEGLGMADAVYNGQMNAWRKFANSLKLKMAMLMADSDPAAAQIAAEAAVVGGVFTSNADNAKLVFSTIPPNTNPVWEDLVQSGRKDFVACKTIVNLLSNLQDPRLPFYFTKDGTGNGYSGGEPGNSSSYALFSKPSEAITEPNYPVTLLDYSEVEFYLAEAKERGYAIPGTAASHYGNAIRASILDWGGSNASADLYLNQPSVAYLTATGPYQQKIGIQKWLALYNRPFDSWIEWRRLDFPKLEKAVEAVSDIPLRYTYPVQEQNYNGDNYKAAAAAIGGDVVTTKLWFDKF